MQVVMLSIPSASAAGPGRIRVEVGGLASNELDFAVAPGRIFYLKGGTDAQGAGSNTTGDGSYGNPWRTLGAWRDDCSGALTKGILMAGDVIYSLGGEEMCFDADTARPRGFTFDEAGGTPTGTQAQPVRLAAYPGRNWIVKAVGQGEAAIASGDGAHANWIEIAKQDWYTDAMGGVPDIDGVRVVGVAVTNNVQGANGSSGAFTSNRGSAKFLGNYIHDFGVNTDSNQHHTTYVGGDRYVEPFRSTQYPAPEFAWNFLDNNFALYGFHVYLEGMPTVSEGYTGLWSGITKIHHNVMRDQAGTCIDFSAGESYCGTNGCRWVSNETWIYNNLCINGGIYTPSASIGTPVPISISGNAIWSHFKFYNNVVYSGCEPPSTAQAMLGAYGTGILQLAQLAGTWEWWNNIVVDTKGCGWMYYGGPDYDGNATGNGNSVKPPTSAGNNIWYSTYPGGRVKPGWDSSSTSRYVDPLFTNPSAFDFTLQSNGPVSPGIDNGADVSSVVGSDFLGVLRPQGSGFDIGVFEYVP